jgi:hypothetical protein
MTGSPGNTANFYDQFSKFRDSRRLLSNNSEIFYIFPDCRQENYPVPATISDAIDYGLVVIASVGDGKYSLEIASENYTGSMFGLELILFEWALYEGYHW